MVNVEEFANRINILLNHYNISAAILAEKIDVQRSSISHILSGRNKPSLDFVLKILKAFPDVELYWLLNGVGSFPAENNKVEKQLPPIVQNETITEFKKELIDQNITTDEIERIVIFFKDGTFKNYKP